MALSAEQLTELQNKLTQLRTDLDEQLRISAGSVDTVMLDQTLVGRVSRVDAMQQQSMARSTRDKVERRLRRVALALAAMERGEYGYCRQCEEEISYPRLQAQPEATLCIGCQNRADQQ